jgi:predicted transcriptional regulator
MSNVKVLHIRVASREYVKRRTIEIATGTKPLQPGEPKLYVSSFDSLAKILTERNMLLLEMIRNSQPQSVADLARLSKRAKSNLSRTLHSMEKLGIVELKERAGRKVPTTKYDKVKVECTIGGTTDAELRKTG